MCSPISLIYQTSHTFTAHIALHIGVGVKLHELVKLGLTGAINDIAQAVFDKFGDGIEVKIIRMSATAQQVAAKPAIQRCAVGCTDIIPTDDKAAICQGGDREAALKAGSYDISQKLGSLTKGSWHGDSRFEIT